MSKQSAPEKNATEQNHAQSEKQRQKEEAAAKLAREQQLAREQAAKEAAEARLREAQTAKFAGERFGAVKSPAQANQNDVLATAAKTRILPELTITTSSQSLQDNEYKYKVEKGDSIWNIAKREVSTPGKNDPLNELISLKSDEIVKRNGLNKHGRSPDSIDVGETLYIPRAQTLREQPVKNVVIPSAENKTPSLQTEITAGGAVSGAIKNLSKETTLVANETVSVPAKLDAKSITAISRDLKESLEKKTLFVDTPDSEKVLRLLASRNANDYQAIEQEFKRSNPNSDLRSALRNKLSDVDYRKAESLLNTQDGRTNDAGNLMVGLTVAKNDRNSGQTQVLNSISTLNSQQIKLLEADYQRNYSSNFKDAVANSNSLSPETKQAFAILAKGSDQRTVADINSMIDIAVRTHDKELALIALRGDTSEAKSARQALNRDVSFLARYKDAFGDDQSVKDILKDGRVSIATVVSNDTGKLFFLNNKANVVSVLDSASDDERRDFLAGRNLALSGRPAQFDQDRSALEYYNKIHAAFSNGGNAREVSIWEDHLLNKGGSVISRLAEKQNNGWTDDGGWGSGHSARELIGAAQLTQRDWMLLNDSVSGATMRRDLEASLKTYATPQETQLILDTINKKAAVAFEESSRVNPDILKLVELTANNGKPDGQVVAQSLVGLSATEIDKYKNNTDGFRDKINLITKDLNGAESFLSRRVLDQIEKSRRIDIDSDPVAKVLKDVVDRTDAGTILSDYQKLIQDKDVLARLNKPESQISQEDQLLKTILIRTIQGEAFNRGATANQAVWASEDVTRVTLATGNIPVSAKLWLDMPRKGLYAEVAQAADAERTNALKYLNDDEKQLVQVVQKQNGKSTLADDLRSFVIGDGSKYQSFENQLQSLTPEQKQALKSEYQAKYGSLDDQFLSRVDSKDQVLYKKYLSPESSFDGRQDYYDNLVQRLKSQGGFSPDGSGLSVERASTLQAEELQKFQAQFKKLPKEQQEALNKQFAEAIDQYRQSKGKLKDLVVDSTIAAAAIAAAPFSGGVSLTGLSYIAAGGAAFRLAAGKVIEGNDFNSSPENVLKEILTGGTTAATAFIGPEALLGLTKVGSVAAENTAKVLATSGSRALLREGGEKALQENLKFVFGQAALTGREITLKDLDQITAAVIKENATAAEKQALRETIKTTFTQELTDESKRSLRESVEQYLKVQARESINNGVVAGTSNVVGELVVAPLNKDGLNAEQLANTAFTGFAAGAILPVVFKTVLHGTSAARDLVVNVTKGSDGHLYINPDVNGHVKVAHADGTETVIQPGQKEPYQLKNGDQVVEAQGYQRTASQLNSQRETSPNLLSKTWTDNDGVEWSRPNLRTNKWQAADGSTYTNENGTQKWEYADGRKRIVEKSGADWTFDPQFKRWSDQHGNKKFELPDRVRHIRIDGTVSDELSTGTLINYTGNGKNVEVVNKRGQSTKYEYGLGGRHSEIQKIEFPDGRVLERQDAEHFVEKFPSGEKRPDRIVEARYKRADDGGLIVDDGITQTTINPEGKISRQNSPQIFEIRGNVTDEFHQKLDRALMDLPTEVRRLLKDKGIKVVIGDTIGQISPSKIGVQPRGWEIGMTWENADGFYDARKKIAAVTERLKDRHGNIIDSNRGDGVLRHEVGHAVDEALGHYANSSDFQIAYQADKANIEANFTANEKQRLEYFLQETNGNATAGRSEAFAEVFGIIHGGGSSYHNIGLIKRAFPHTWKVIENRLAELKATNQ